MIRASSDTARASGALNASPEAVLDGRLPARLEGLPEIAWIVLEITENAPIADYDAFSAALAPLRARGLELAIDDTGAGFASMRHILRWSPTASSWTAPSSS